MISRLLSFIRADRNGVKVPDVKIDTSGGANVTAEHFAPAGDDSHPLPDDYVFTAPVAGTGRVSVSGYYDPVNEGQSQAGERRAYSRSPTEEGGKRVIAEHWLKNDGTVVTTSYVLEGDTIRKMSEVTQSASGEVLTEVFDGQGTVKVRTRLKDDGTALTENEEASSEMKPSGEVNTQNGSGFYKLQDDGTVDINGFTIAPNGAAESPVSVTAPTVDGTSSVQAAGKELVGHTHAGSPTAPSGPVSPTGANQ